MNFTKFINIKRVTDVTKNIFQRFSKKQQQQQKKSSKITEFI